MKTTSNRLKSKQPRPPSDTYRLLRDREVAQLLGLSVRQVWKLTASGELPEPVKLGRSTRWRERDLRDRIFGEEAAQ